MHLTLCETHQRRGQTRVDTPWLYLVWTSRTSSLSYPALLEKEALDHRTTQQRNKKRESDAPSREQRNEKRNSLQAGE